MRFRRTAIRLFAVNAGLVSIFALGGSTSDAATATPACTSANLSLGHEGKRSEATGENSVLFTLTNRAKFTCHLYGHPGVSLDDNKGHALPLRFTWTGIQYVSQSPPKTVVLRPSARGYFLVAKYRCDKGLVKVAKTIRVYPPNSRQQMVGNAAPFGEGGGFWYCKGGSNDPGNLVEVSPVRASPRVL